VGPSSGGVKLEFYVPSATAELVHAAAGDAHGALSRWLRAATDAHLATNVRRKMGESEEDGL
jgi:hypothetical protein